MTEPDLKPCPFCGEVPTQLNAGGSYVYCHGCNAKGPYRAVDAITAWNTRADSRPTDIAAAVQVKPLEWDGEDGNGFGPALPDGVSYFVIDESGDGDYSWELIANGRTLEDSGGVTWRSIGKARDGANGHYTRSVVDAISIPTDTAALDAVRQQARDMDREVAADRIEALNAELDQAKAALREIKSVECIHCTDLFNELADAVLGEANGDEK